MSQYWFARRFPVGHPRKATTPVSREGWLVVGGFIAAMIVGGLLFLSIALSGSPITGAIVFVVIAVLAGAAFIGIAYRKGEHQRTVEDYRRAAGTLKT